MKYYNLFFCAKCNYDPQYRRSADIFLLPSKFGPRDIMFAVFIRKLQSVLYCRKIAWHEFYNIIYEGRSVGTITLQESFAHRISIEGSIVSAPEISIRLDEDYRGRGIGGYAIDLIFESAPNFVALVREENENSQHLFKTRSHGPVLAVKKTGVIFHRYQAAVEKE